MNDQKDQDFTVWNELIALARAEKIDVPKRSYCGLARAFATRDNKIHIVYSMVHWLETFEVFVDGVSVLRTHDEDKAFELFLSEYKKKEGI